MSLRALQRIKEKLKNQALPIQFVEFVSTIMQTAKQAKTKSHVHLFYVSSMLSGANYVAAPSASKF